MILWLLLVSLGLGVRVFFRRLWRGRRRPGWSWWQETVFEVARWSARRLAARGVAATRAHLDRATVPFTLYRRRLRLTPITDGEVRGEWLTHRRGASGRAILYLHGGGYCSCSPRTHRDLMARLALAAPADLLGLDYRLAPEHPFPAALEDAVAAYQWLLARGVAPHRVVIAGDSAGGGLTLATLLALRERGLPLPAAGVLLSPWVDLTARGGSLEENAPFDYVAVPELLSSLTEAYCGDGDPTRPLVSPAFADLTGLPPLRLLVGGAEVLRDQCLGLAAQARAVGVPVELEVAPDMVHVWPAFAFFLREGRRSIARVGEFVRRVTV